MNRNFRVITINGIRGMLVAIFIVLGLIAGFVISPGWVCMHIWNYFMAQSGNFITMNLLQGIMLWSIIALSLYAINNKRPLIGFGSYPGLSPDQIKDIMNRAKMSEDKIKNEIDILNKELQINKSAVINSENQDKSDDSVNNEEEVKGHM
jgi:hypothetical protein